MWIHRIQKEYRRLQKAIRVRQHPLSVDELRAGLDALGEPPAADVMVHSALSTCGYLRGGSLVLIDAWRRWVNGRNLILPTHTYCYPGETTNDAIYDFRRTPSLVGAVSDFYWRQPGVVRNLHPTHSLAGEGSEVESLFHGHEQCDTACGPGTPYQRFIDRDGSVLMFGCSMNTYTLFYTTMHAAQVPYQYYPERCALRYVGTDARVHELQMRRHDVTVPRRFTEMGTWLESQGLLIRRRLGQGELLYIPRAGAVHRRLLEELIRDPLFLVADQARESVLARGWKQPS